MGEQSCRQQILLTLIRQVVQSEAELVLARPLRIVPQLRLHLTVRLAVYQHIGAGGNGAAYIGQARALLDGGVIGTAFYVHQGFGRAHEKRLRQNPGAKACLLLQTGLFHVLDYQGGHACNLGGGHGGAGHGLVALTTGNHAVHRVDVAARGGDFRL